MSINEPIQYMSQALDLAKRGRFSVSPNPMVGCLVVKNNQVIGQGYHQKSGEAHAEIHALQQAGVNARDATVYITLEPCCHYGKTPPCTLSLIKAGIKKIVIATLDPNPLVSGKGASELRNAGIEVEIGLMQTEAQQLNEVFFHYIKNKRPFVIAKWAMSLDGKTITHPNDSRDITSIQTQRAAHEIRHQVDAILIGANTAMRDNPQLTVRYQTNNEIKHPIRIVLTSKGNLPFDLKIFDSSLPAKTIVATSKDADKTWCNHLSKKNVELLILPKNVNGQIDLPSLLHALGKLEITSLLVEGGMTVHESFFNEQLVNKIHVYLAPVIIGSLEKKKFIPKLNIIQQTHDICFTANYEEKTYV